MYKINDYIMYGKDVCKIQEIEEKKFNNEDYYLLIPLKDPSLKIQIPISNKKIRNLINLGELESLLHKIPEIKPLSTDEKFLETEYKRLLSKGTHEDLITIIKTTYLRNQKRLQNNKKTTEKDNTYFQLAEEYLYNEISIVLGYNFEQTKNYIIDKIKNLETSTR